MYSFVLMFAHITSPPKTEFFMRSLMVILLHVGFDLPKESVWIYVKHFELFNF